jgi:hypothetical protein
MALIAGYRMSSACNAISVVMLAILTALTAVCACKDWSKFRALAFAVAVLLLVSALTFISSFLISMSL